MGQEYYRGDTQVDSRIRRVRRVTYKRNHRLRRFIALIAGVFTLGLLAVFVCSQVAVLGYQIVAIKQDIAELEQKNKRLELSIAQLSSLERIEKVASSQLGMCKPGDAQMLAMEENVQPVPVVDLRTPQAPLQAADGEPMEKVYKVLSTLAARNKVIGMNQ